MGYLPYAMIENYGRLVNYVRNWRNAKTPANREASQADAVYVAASSVTCRRRLAAMHMTIHYNGWAATAPNPGTLRETIAFTAVTNPLM